MLNTVIFDLDGTLLDTSSGFTRATERIVWLYGLPPIPKQEIGFFIGPPIQDSFARYYKLSSEQAKRLGNAWRDVYKNEFLLDAQPYDGIYDVLKFCRMNGIKTGVATNKREDYTMHLLDHFGFLPLLDCVCGSDFEGKLKKPELLRQCMQRIGVEDPAKCILIGDTPSDQLAAEETGMMFLGVTYGFGFEKKEPAYDDGKHHFADTCMALLSDLKYHIINLEGSQD